MQRLTITSSPETCLLHLRRLYHHRRRPQKVVQRRWWGWGRKRRFPRSAIGGRRAAHCPLPSLRRLTWRCLPLKVLWRIGRGRSTAIGGCIAPDQNRGWWEAAAWEEIGRSMNYYWYKLRRRKRWSVSKCQCLELGHYEIFFLIIKKQNIIFNANIYNKFELLNQKPSFAFPFLSFKTSLSPDMHFDVTVNGCESQVEDSHKVKWTLWFGQKKKKWTLWWFNIIELMINIKLSICIKKWLN